ncbi:hypothetical protein I317_03469 [Kwoniella heveanensis CBS 569]|nr:hypothetical protein I317_03469 [Kwoniella heveanensis CBS 569]
MLVNRQAEFANFVNLIFKNENRNAGVIRRAKDLDATAADLLSRPETSKLSDCQTEKDKIDRYRVIQEVKEDTGDASLEQLTTASFFLSETSSQVTRRHMADDDPELENLEGTAASSGEFEYFRYTQVASGRLNTRPRDRVPCHLTLLTAHSTGADDLATANPTAAHEHKQRRVKLQPIKGVDQVKSLRPQ